MKRALFLLAVVLFAFGCKKDEPEETTNNTNNTNNPPQPTTPTQIKVSVDLYGEVQDFIFGENGYSLQYLTSVMHEIDTVLMAPSAAISNFGSPDQEYPGYFSIQLPYSTIAETTYNADQTQAFLDYFTETQIFDTPYRGLVFVTLADGSQWTTEGTTNSGEAISGDWNMNYVHEDSDLFETVRCHGSVVVEMRNIATNVLANMTITYTMRFAEPA